MADETQMGMFTTKDLDDVRNIIKKINPVIQKYPEEKWIFGELFKDEKHVGSGDVGYAFRDETYVDVSGDAGFVAEGGEPNVVKESLSRFEIRLMPKIYYGAAVTLEAKMTDPLHGVKNIFKRQFGIAKEAVMKKANYEMANLLLADALKNSGTPQTGDGKYWYNSADAGDNLPPKYGINDFSSTHRTTWKVVDSSGTEYTYNLDGHIETTATTLNKSHLLAIVEHIAHHGYDNKTIRMYVHPAVTTALLNMTSTNQGGTIPESVYKDWFVSGKVKGQILGMVIIENAWIPKGLALFVPNGIKPATRLVNIPLSVTNPTMSNRLVIEAGVYMRFGLGINARGAGYVAYFDI